MRSYIERAKDFVKQVYPFICDCEYPWTVGQQMIQFNRDYNRKVLVSSGVARIALITSDYVVKFDYDPDEVEYVGGGEAEVELYERAKRDGFAYLLAEVTRFEYEGRRFYIMPRIRGIDPDRWEYADYYMTDEEQEWCDRVELSDLHSSNYGFRNGKVCIIDYACRKYSFSSSSES